MLDARLARELEFDDVELHDPPTAVCGDDTQHNKKQTAGASKETRRRKDDAGDGGRQRKKETRRRKDDDRNLPDKQRRKVDPADTNTAESGAVRLFRRVPLGTPCQLDVANRPGQPTASTRPAPPRARVASSDSDDEEDKLLQVVVDAAHIYSTAQEAAKKAAANISDELIGAYRICFGVTHH